MKKPQKNKVKESLSVQMMISRLVCKKLSTQLSHFLTRSDLAKCHWNIVNFTRAAGAKPRPPPHILGL